MAKSYDDETNERLRAVARRVMKDHMDGKQIRLAEKLGVSGSFVSEFLSGTRGAGLEMLVGLARFAPLDILEILHIDAGVVAALLAGSQDEKGTGIELLPDVIRRATRACIELSGCTPADACASALEIYAQFGDLPNTTPDWWCAQIRQHILIRAEAQRRTSPKLLGPSKAP